MIPEVQKALTCDKPCANYVLKLDDKYPVPKPGSNQVLVRLTHTGVCHTDLSHLTDHWAPIITTECKVVGHEGVGRIVAHGSDIRSPESVPIGMRVGMTLLKRPCNLCDECVEPDHEAYCFHGDLRTGNTDGTFCQYQVMDVDYLIPIPDGVPDELAGPILCGGVTVYKAIKKSGLYAGQWIAIMGAGGGLGTMAIQIARSRGIRTIAIDSGDKREICESESVEAFVDFTKVADVPAEIRKITGGLGVHVALVLVPAPVAYQQAVEMLRMHGTLLSVGITTPDASFPVKPFDLVLKDIKLIGTLIGTRWDIKEALDLAARGLFKPHIQVYPMEECRKVLDAMHQGKLLGRAVLKLD
ncbi:hypothetical protein CANCADRAFT_31736 [Tortispora caseinolytica NRRL Y-17796]|uniref:Enoyl reductase (ER) domain-containing protein n=1 Tax=Tortispora caseinolytica NRRL Y-17796 TaxID=767744 RepID=A0A1E4TGL5_9ASCO|nr:hypothetical protein CANCADRAFT_31736 [Tortispora caseinolytica NRRL Y-17796]